MENERLEQEYLTDGSRIETPYDEAGVPLSFRTSPEAIVYEGKTLKEWLDIFIKGGTNGKDGLSIEKVETKFTKVSEEQNNELEVKRLNESAWTDKSPELTNEEPYLWKRVRYLTKKDGTFVLISVSYEYCGKKGDTGLDVEWKEWIFKVINSTENEEIIKGKLLTELNIANSNPNFLNNDFIPVVNNVPGKWTDDMLEVDSTSKIQWCASRYKKDNIWREFGNLHVFGRKAKNGINSNNIYTATSEITTEDWENDKDILINGIYLSEDSGKININPGLKLIKEWKDSVPNVDSTKVIYLATAYFLGNQCINIDDPIRITGSDGVGSDGAGIEFAYYATDEPAPFDSDGNELLPALIGKPEHFYSSSFSDWVDSAGECPISESTPYVYVKLRLGLYADPDNWYWVYLGTKYGVGPGTTDVSNAPSDWNYGWSAPKMWSTWGQDGVDGDGVQYVYLQLTEELYQIIKNDPTKWHLYTNSDNSGGSVIPENPIGPELVDFEILPGTGTLDYATGDEFTLDGLVIRTTYSDGSTNEIKYNDSPSDWGFSNVGNLTTLTNSVQIFYKGLHKPLNITVKSIEELQSPSGPVIPIESEIREF